MAQTRSGGTRNDKLEHGEGGDNGSQQILMKNDHPQTKGEGVTKRLPSEILPEQPISNRDQAKATNSNTSNDEVENSIAKQDTDAAKQVALDISKLTISNNNGEEKAQRDLSKEMLIEALALGATEGVVDGNDVDVDRDDDEEEVDQNEKEREREGKMREVRASAHDVLQQALLHVKLNKNEKIMESHVVEALINSVLTIGNDNAVLRSQIDDLLTLNKDLHKANQTNTARWDEVNIKVKELKEITHKQRMEIEKLKHSKTVVNIPAQESNEPPTEENDARNGTNQDSAKGVPQETSIPVQNTYGLLMNNRDMDVDLGDLEITQTVNNNDDTNNNSTNTNTNNTDTTTNNSNNNTDTNNTNPNNQIKKKKENNKNKNNISEEQTKGIYSVDRERNAVLRGLTEKADENETALKKEITEMYDLLDGDIIAATRRGPIVHKDRMVQIVCKDKSTQTKLVKAHTKRRRECKEARERLTPDTGPKTRTKNGIAKNRGQEQWWVREIQRQVTSLTSLVGQHLPRPQVHRSNQRN